MNNKVNFKARINRHSRIFKDNIIWKNIFTNNKITWYNFVIFVMIVLIPIYPTLTSFAHWNAASDFYRWDIDESSILWVYEWDNEVDASVPIVESTDSFLSINTLLDDNRNLLWTNEIIIYEVKSWDSFWVISDKFEITINSIMWANDFNWRTILQPWDKIKIPPVSWVIHIVKSWDTLLGIATKYDIDMNKILEQNLLSSKSILKKWDSIIIPWARKIKKVVPQIKKVPSKYTSSAVVKSHSVAKSSSSSYVAKSWKYKLVWRKPYSWLWGNCTYYVASYKKVNWRWNANQWMKNARAKWHKTWNKARIWAIVQFEGRWYNPRYGHVWIVIDIKWNNIIVSDMNYRRLNEVTYRKVSINDRTITWYIYVD